MSARTLQSSSISVQPYNYNCLLNHCKALNIDVLTSYLQNMSGLNYAIKRFALSSACFAQYNHYYFEQTSRFLMNKQCYRCLFNFMAHSEPNTAGRSRSALNRIVLAAKEIQPMPNHRVWETCHFPRRANQSRTGDAGAKIPRLTAWR